MRADAIREAGRVKIRCQGLRGKKLMMQKMMTVSPLPSVVKTTHQRGTGSVNRCSTVYITPLLGGRTGSLWPLVFEYRKYKYWPRREGTGDFP